MGDTLTREILQISVAIQNTLSIKRWAIPSKETSYNYGHPLQTVMHFLHIACITPE